MKRSFTLVAALLALPVHAHAQHEHSPYAGMETAEGTALTPEELRQLRGGEGMRLALAAELNHYPGPRHVLDLGGELDLTADQRTRVEEIFEAMRADAIRVGESIIEVEGHLAGAFREARADADAIRLMTAHLASLRGELQAIHLTAHVTTRALLTEEQVERYDTLRGYASGH